MANQNEYRKARLPQYAKYQRNWRASNPKKVLVSAARSRAKRDGVPFNISVDTLAWPTHCPVLGVELDYNRSPPGQRMVRSEYPTLDRRDNDKGYVVGNVFVISHRANRIKSDATPEELVAILRYARGSD